MKRFFIILYALCIFSENAIASDYFWIGGSGNWDDLNHWAKTSGGFILQTQIPTALDDVYFDNLSGFTPGNNTVTINVPTAFCHSMNWTGAANNPILAGSSPNNVKIYGSLMFISAMSISFTGPFNFSGTSLGNTITMNGQNFRDVTFDGAGGGWSLQDAFTCTSNINFLRGSLNTNSQTVSALVFYSINSNTRSLTLGSSLINLSQNGGYAWYVYHANLTLSSGASTINITGFNGNFYTRDIVTETYYNLNFTNSASSSLGSGLLSNNSGTLFFHDVTFSGSAAIQGNNVFENLTMAAGKTYELASGYIQNITSSLNASATCNDIISIQSSNSGSQASVSKTSGSILVNYVSLKDINATGGAVFTANNAVDLGNNTGWSINTVTPQSRYWVGGAGDWSDQNHWSINSGSSGGACLPTPYDDVYFDNLSGFTPGNNTVTINVPTAFCHSMNWTGAANNPILAGSSPNNVKIYGSLMFISAMSISFTGPFNFSGTSLGNTITMNGQNFRDVTFDGAGGGWSLQDAFTCTSNINFLRGSLNTNSQTVSALVFYSINSNTRSLTLGSSLISLSQNGGYAWYVYHANLTLSSGASTINITGFNGNFYTRDIVTETYYNLNFTNSASSSLGSGLLSNNSGTLFFHDVTFSGSAAIQGNNVFENLTMAAGKTYELASGYIQNITSSLNASATCNDIISIQSSNSGSQASVSKTSGSILVNYVSLKDINATGGAVFTANNAVDLGNNTGWSINTVTPQSRYWVGGAGDWSDQNHWSINSGSSGGACLPTPYDDVYFDNLSGFTPGNNTVTINVPTAFCHSMNWTGAANNPILAGSSPNNVKIYGSLMFISAMSISFTGPFNFSGTSLGNTITMNGQNFRDVTFDGAGGGWSLQDAFTCTSNINFLRGSLNTNSQTVSALVFYSINSNTRSLTLGSSLINLSQNGGYAWYVYHANLTLSSGASTINITGFNGNFYTRDIVTETYYNLNFTNSASSSLGSGLLSNNSGTLFFHDVTFSGSAAIQGNNVFENLTMAASKTYELASGYIQNIQNHLNVQGSCLSYILLQASSNGNFASFNKISGTVYGFNIHLRDIHCTGGATFNAYNSVDLGGNNGWIFSILPPLSNPGVINGPTLFCPGAVGISYHTAPVAGAISYNWTVPSGATITSGQGDTLITVDFGSTAGNITVNAFSGCAISANSNLPVAINLGTLAAATGSVQVCNSKLVSAAGTFYIASPCNLIAKIVPSGASPVTGNINSCVIIDGSIQYYNAEPYVQRHYDIEPSNNSTTATATVTLYFKDSEFEAFNAINSAFPDLPTVAGGGNSDPNIAKLRVTQYHGLPIAPHNVGNPAPGFYTTNTGVLITPTSVNYSSTYGHWEITIQVNGFSGFYVHTNIYAPLPIDLNYFAGTKQGSKHILNWKVTCNSSPRATIMLERSFDSRSFSAINIISADSLRCQQPFEYIDLQPLMGINYYRLKMVDEDGKITYSSIVALLNASKGFEIIYIVPNPVTGSNFRLNLTSAQNSAINILITDIQGRVVANTKHQAIAGYNSFNLNSTNLGAGTYIISCFLQSEKPKIVKFVKM